MRASSKSYLKRINKNQWDQVALEEEMDKARQNGLGLVAMKTCSGGPLAASPGTEASYEEALRWIIRRGKVHTMAVAMANYSQLRENLRALQ
jgi:predicted aldo/keto reductase-like oxidoreductase